MDPVDAWLRTVNVVPLQVDVDDFAVRAETSTVAPAIGVFARSRSSRSRCRETSAIALSKFASFARTVREEHVLDLAMHRADRVPPITQPVLPPSRCRRRSRGSTCVPVFVYPWNETRLASRVRAVDVAVRLDALPYAFGTSVPSPAPAAPSANVMQLRTSRRRAARTCRRVRTLTALRAQSRFGVIGSGSCPGRCTRRCRRT